MSGFTLHANAGCQCTHAAPATIKPAQARVLVSEQLVATMASQIVVAGCTFQTPCTTVRWLMPSTRVLVDGERVLLLPASMPAPAVCLSAVPASQGPPIVGAVQHRVVAT